jgi:hypothetical protein
LLAKNGHYHVKTKEQRYETGRSTFYQSQAEAFEIPSTKSPPACPDPSRVVEEGFGEVKTRVFQKPPSI